MKIGIIGCGLIGKKRANALVGHQLVACADSSLDRAKQLAQQYFSSGCLVRGTHPTTATNHWQDVLKQPEIDLVIVATPHNCLAEMTLAALSAGKHVLVEKPAARFATELEPVITATRQSDCLVRVGFNHRYHRAFRQARTIVDRGELGELMWLRARYGHGGRLGYDQEWRAQPEISGGGELIDQGVHLIDLARWFLGDFTEIQGFAHTYFWQMPVDDNAFLLLKTAQQQVAWLHASCTEWKNLFSFELYGKRGKLHIEGLGGSYGVERLSCYKMLPEMGPPETTIWEYPRGDDSWEVEFKEFVEDIELKRQPSANIEDAYAALNIVAKIYSESGYDYRL
ncbi:MAG: LmbZ [Thiotrichaceae bacterium IS1]|nr:MAG: LmbZ [Thiotrichaceae bacterium IS1]